MAEEVSQTQQLAKVGATLLENLSKARGEHLAVQIVEGIQRAGRTDLAAEIVAYLWRTDKPALAHVLSEAVKQAGEYSPPDRVAELVEIANGTVADWNKMLHSGVDPASIQINVEKSQDDEYLAMLIQEEKKLDALFHSDDALSEKLIHLGFAWFTILVHVTTKGLTIQLSSEEALAEIHRREVILDQRLGGLDRFVQTAYSTAVGDYQQNGQITTASIPQLQTLGYWLVFCPCTSIQSFFFASGFLRDLGGIEFLNLFDEVRGEIARRIGPLPGSDWMYEPVRQLRG